MKKTLVFDDVKINPADQLRVVTLNILNNPDRAQSRYEALADELQEQDVDVLCLQEVLHDFDNHNALYLEPLAERLGLKVSSSFYQGSKPAKRVSFGNAILTRVDAKTSGKVLLTPTSKPHINVPYANVVVLEINGYEVHILTAHLAWGGHREQDRLEQVLAINAYAETVKATNPLAIVIVTGDFNSVPESVSMRYLKGLGLSPSGEGAYWVDAWDLHGGDTDGFTARADGLWATSTAKGTGSLLTSLIPRRRIDYILVHGWVYGRVGCPLNISLIADHLTKELLPISDHYGLMTDIWIPVSI